MQGGEMQWNGVIVETQDIASVRDGDPDVFFWDYLVYLLLIKEPFRFIVWT